MSVDLNPCLKGQTIAAKPEFQGHLASIRQLVSAPPDAYAALYLGALYAVMELCQAIPCELDAPKAYGFLDRQLRLTISVLKLRRGKMLPLHTDSETIAEQEALWTYALFTASLLWQLAKIQQIACIDLYKNAGERLGCWHPIAGSLAEANTHYKITDQVQSLILKPSLFQAVMVGKIMPSVGLRWLAGDPSVFNEWWDVVTGEAKPNNILMGFLSSVSEQAGVVNKDVQPVETPENREDGTPELHPTNTPGTNTSAAKDRLLLWLDTPTAASNHENQIKNISPLFLRVTEGLFIPLENLEAFRTQQADFPSLDSLLMVLEEALVKSSEDQDKEDETDKGVFFKFRPVRYEERRVLEGVILAEDFISEKMSALPLQKEFISVTSL